MKTLLIIALLSLCLAVSCGEPISGSATVPLSSSEAVNIYPITIDSCEYYVTYVHGGKTLTHKGNCKNPIHSCNK